MTHDKQDPGRGPLPPPDGSSAEPDARIIVDQPGGPTGPRLLDRVRGAKRRPVVPAWARSRQEFEAAAKGVTAYAGHVSAYHLARAPWYALRLALRAPRGAARFVGGVLRWLVDAEGEPLRQAAATREDIEEYLKLSRQRDRRVRWRTVVGVAASVLGPIAALVAYVLAPAWTLAVVAAVAVMALGRLGQPADDPVIHRAVEIPRAAKLTSDIVLRALGALGIPAINQAQSKGGPGFAFTAPITRDGPGWLAEGDLPYGVTVADVVDRRERLASGLRRPLGCVWPEAVPNEHTGRLRLWVGDQDMSQTKQPKWPLLAAKPLDLFRAQPFATDQRGRWVAQSLMYVSGIVGAVPRMGKTFLLRLVLLIACMDLRAEIHAYDLKGTGDLSALAHIAHRYRAGEENEDIAYALADLRELRAELRRRAKVIRELPKDLCPESKVTSALADMRKLGLHPIVVGVDECQKWFEHPKYGAEFEEHCTDLVKRGPALGITLLLATQRPDSKSLPTGISANATVRWCLKVMGQIENDMVLGTGSYKRGIRANTLAWGDKGIAWFVGEGADARIVRCVEINAPTAEALALRVRALRQQAGRLTGHAVGEQPEPEASYDLLADVAAALPSGKAKAWSEDIVARLAELRPDVYGQWSPEQLANALKPYGIRTVQVWGTTEDGKGANRRGVRRADVLAAIARRDDGTAAA
ncbi:cell division protein FtsK [Actinacidiphila paucisporea]|uniref:DNA segregation ATPase FtsK/SpoIIIE, S-DNA-T family n=1 Tax=Actinacidiphila paucisporea TaxID=310782 RepID=A0A1M6TIF6_9ACTN|nr:cell division protein FtsK [Actinacidiphila paucisporea]SHK56666.1 DNA segregation ATPase FtsK/SpoIIIE, S-DNA-T family [Actinacidiphila paucisporea]